MRRQIYTTYRFAAFFVACATLFILLSISTLFVTTTNINIDDDSPIKLSGAWNYSFTPDETPKAFPSSGIVTSDQNISTIILSTVLPEYAIAGSSFCIKTSHEMMTVSLDGSTLYDYTFTAKELPAKSPGKTWHFIRLPHDIDGKTLTVTLHEAYPQKTFTLGSAYLGTKTSEVFAIVKHNIGNMILSMLLFMFGLVLLGMYFVTLRFDHTKKNLLYISIFSVMTSFWAGAETSLFQFFVANPYFIYCTSYLIMLLLPVPMLLFIRTSSKQKYCPLFNLLLVLTTGNAVVVTALHFLHILEFEESYISFHVIVLLSVLLICFSCISEFFSKTHKQMPTYIGGLALGMFSLIDVIRCYLPPVPDDCCVFFRFGMTIFICIVGAELLLDAIGVYKTRIKAKTLEILAYVDAMTELKNRTCFEEHMEQLHIAHQKALANGLESPITFVVFDINNLKLTNDTKGHKEGDRLIKISAAYIRETFEGIGTAYRIGGDEFVVICEQVYHDEVKSCIQRLIAKIEEHNATNAMHISLAYGQGTFDKNKDADLHSLFVRVDEEMYSRKVTMKSLHEENKVIQMLRSQ